MKVGDLVRCIKEDQEDIGLVGMIMEFEDFPSIEEVIFRVNSPGGFWVKYLGEIDWRYQYPEEVEIVSGGR